LDAAVTYWLWNRGARTILCVFSLVRGRELGYGCNTWILRCLRVSQLHSLPRLGNLFIKENKTPMELLPLATGVSASSDSPTNQLEQTVTREERIAELAYALWQYRGCPAGTADEDWLEAERQILRPQAKAFSTVGATR
jgi:hypothetical protein